MSPASVSSQTVTNVSGTVAIASSSTSIGASSVTLGVSPDPILIENVAAVVTTADKIALASCIILALSWVYNMYSSRRRRRIDEAEYELRKKEYELELAKFKQGSKTDEAE